MPFLIGRWMVEDANFGTIVRGPAALLNGRRIGQAVLELAEYDSSEPPSGWFKVVDARSIGYKLELDAEKPRDT